jgi:hypothetical protein
MPRKLLTMSTWHVRLASRASPSHQGLTPIKVRGDARDAYKHAMRGSLSTERGINACFMQQ